MPSNARASQRRSTALRSDNGLVPCATLEPRSGSRPAPSGPFEEFGTFLAFDGDLAVLSLFGELDIFTAPALGATLQALVDEGNTDIVLDLDALTFFDASGIRVLARVLALLQARRGRLSLRSVRPSTRRVLDITGFSALVDAHMVEADHPDRPDDEVTANEHPQRGSTRNRDGAFATNNDTIDAALRLLVTLAGMTVPGADGVSVSLHRHGRMITAAASDDTVLRMDHHQYETGEGPCLAAAAEGHWFRIDALAEEDRWPAFVPRAIGDGIASIISSPLLTDGRSIGALNMYSRGEAAFGRGELELAALFATHVTGILVDAGADVSDEESTARIHTALHSRKVIAQAEGMLMERLGVSSKDAAAILVRASRSGERTVLHEASALTGSKLDVGAPADASAAPPGSPGTQISVANTP